jgi:hypothetical protein
MILPTTLTDAVRRHGPRLSVTSLGGRLPPVIAGARARSRSTVPNQSRRPVEFA